MKKITEKEIMVAQDELRHIPGIDPVEALRLGLMLFQSCQNHNEIIERVRKIERRLKDEG